MQKQIQQIQKEVDSFLSLEDSFKGKGAEAIRSFYQESHVPFLLLMEGFIRDYEDTLGHIQKSLQSLDSDKRAFIQQSFLQNELQSGIRNAKNVTMGITNDANSSIRSVRDIVHLPAIDDDAFLHQVDQANKKTNQTIENLHMFDKQSTSRLGTAENDLQFMKDYIHKIRGMIKGGKLNIATYSPRELKDLDVHQDMIRRLSKKAATNAFSLDTLLAIGGHSLLSRYVPLSDVIVTYLQKKFKMRTMDYSMRAVQGIIDANSNTISQEEFSILQGQIVEEVTISDYQKVWHGSYLTLRDGRKVREYKDDNGNMRYRFVTEIPENRLKPEEKNAFQKTGESLQEIGSDIWNGLVTRKEKAWNSWYDFGNYITLGSFDVGKNMYSGLQYNAENMLNTPSDFFNWLTIGGVDLVKGVVTPEEQFSKEHLLASFGLATVFIGGVRTPNSLTGTVNKLPNSSPPKVKRTSLSTRIKSSQKLAILTNIREWYRVNVPEIGLVYDSIGGYHLIVKKAEGGSGGGSRGSGKGTGNNRQIDFTRGFDVDPKYSSYEQRVKTTPVNKGEWSNERAESLFISDKTGEIKKYLDEAGVDGVEYKNGMPDFSPFSKGEIKLENMTNDRKSNFSTADEELAKKWSTPEQKWTAEDIADWREDNKYTWHELNDLETIQLVPSKINSVFKHLGGVGEYNIKVKLGD